MAMADMDLVGSINATTSLIEQLGKALLQLEYHKDGDENKILWIEIEKHFRHLEDMKLKEYLELEVQEQALNREESDFRTILLERERAVTAREQDMLDRIQELKDAAVASIAEARAKHHVEPENVRDSKDGQVSSLLGDSHATNTAQEQISSCKRGGHSDGVSSEVKPRPELVQFCEQMDAKGLLNFISGNKKNISSLCEELSIALQSAAEPCSLVLASLDGFYPPDDTAQKGEKSDAALQGMRQSCLNLMQAMATLLAKADPGTDHLLNPEIKQLAKAIADEWKPKLASAGIDATNGNSLAFLQLLATFRITSEFDEDELCKLVLAVCQHRQAPELCRSLGLTHKMPGLVEELINSGRQIEAVHFVHAFQLTENFPLVPLLKAYLKDFKKDWQGKGSNVGGTAAAQNDQNARELAALRVVIQCVKSYKLEAEYPLDPLQKRAAQLEKPKADKKRFGESGRRQQFKKPRGNGGVHGYRAPGVGPAAGLRQGPPAFGDRAAYPAVPMRHPFAGPTSYDYQAPSQVTYAQQGYDQRSYHYPQDDRAPLGTYNMAPSDYGSYPGSGMQSADQQYM